MTKNLYAFTETRTARRTVWIEAEDLPSALRKASDIRKDTSNFDLAYVEDDDIVYYALSRIPSRDEIYEDS